MMHLSYDQQITLIKRLLAPLNVDEIDAGYLAAVVTHSDFTGTYSHGLSRLCIYLRQYMAGALQARPNFRCVSDKDASLAFDCGGGSGIAAVNRVLMRSWNAHANTVLLRASGATARTSAAADTTATGWRRTM